MVETSMKTLKGTKSLNAQTASEDTQGTKSRKGVAGRQGNRRWPYAGVFHKLNQVSGHRKFSIVWLDQ